MVWDKKQGFSFIFVFGMRSCSCSATLVKRLYFPHWIAFAPSFQKSVGHIYVDLSLNFILFHWFVYIYVSTALSGNQGNVGLLTSFFFKIILTIIHILHFIAYFRISLSIRKQIWVFDLYNVESIDKLRVSSQYLVFWSMNMIYIYLLN